MTMIKLTPDNQARAAAGAVAFNAFQLTKGDTDGLSPQSPEEILIDLLSNLRHFAEAAGLDFETANRVAQDHYDFESW
jgi:hypothetical protein